MSVPIKKRSLILAFAGITQRSPLSPDGRVFKRLCNGRRFISKVGDEVEILSYEESFVVIFMRWLGEPLAEEFGAIFEHNQGTDALMAKTRAFVPKLEAHKKRSPPPWEEKPAKAA